MIAVLSYDYPPNDGGISRLAAAVVSGLATREWPAEVLTLAPRAGESVARPEVATVEVPRRKGLRELATLGWLLRRPVGALALATVWNPEGTLAMLLGRPFLVMAHGNEVMPYPRGLRFACKRWLRRRVLTAARQVICNSHYTERLVGAAAPAARTAVVPLGVDAARFTPARDRGEQRAALGLPTDKRIVLSVSRLDAYKGHDVVLKALAALPAPMREQLHYVVAGKGSHQPALVALAQRLGLAAQVSWLGFVDEAKLPRLHACADLFVLCTREDPAARGVEGFGIAFLEAQACGVAVLGTRAGGIPDAVVEGRGGWLIAQDDVDAVTTHLAGLAADAGPYHAMGALGRTRVLAEATWDHYLDKFLPYLGNNA